MNPDQGRDGTPIALQLYTVSAAAEHDFRDVLERVAAMGYLGVELAGLHGVEPAALAAMLQQVGLVVSSAHLDLGDEDSFAANLDAHQSMGVDTFVVPFLHPREFADLDSIGRSADAVNRANQIARDAGASLGYHNHFWELESEIDGRSGLAQLFDRLDDDIFAEVDIYWAQVGGSDPASLVTELGDRVRLLHVKDGPADDPAKSMVAVGAGAIDTAGVIAAAPSAAWHIVELDRCETDMFDAVRASYDFLVGSGLSRGRL